MNQNGENFIEIHVQTYKKLIKEISPVDLTELMKSTLRENEKQLQKQIEFWLRRG